MKITTIILSILVSFVMIGCGSSGTFMRTKDGFVTLTPHKEQCRCVGTTERWKVENNVIVDAEWLGTEPLEYVKDMNGKAYDKATGTIEMNQAGNVIHIDAFIRNGSHCIHRTGSYYLKNATN